MDEELAARNSQPVTHRHTIRLRHPWQHDARGDGLTWSRKFNWPAELNAGETVQLVVEQAPESAVVTLNGNSLGTASTGCFEVTALLTRHNLLTLATEAGKADLVERFPYEVRLEIVAAGLSEE